MHYLLQTIMYSLGHSVSS